MEHSNPHDGGSQRPDNWHATVQAGGGVVIDSNPADEVEEARWKAAAVTEATWGFRTGFSSGELPEREVGILPMPEVEGVLGRIRPSEFQPEQETNQAHVLLVDNLDSFTNNIAESLHRLGAKVNNRRKADLPKTQIQKPSSMIGSPPIARLTSFSVQGRLDLRHHREAWSWPVEPSPSDSIE